MLCSRQIRLLGYVHRYAYPFYSQNVDRVKVYGNGDTFHHRKALMLEKLIVNELWPYACRHIQGRREDQGSPGQIEDCAKAVWEKGYGVTSPNLWLVPKALCDK